MLKLFGIPNCDTVKKARVFLEKNGAEVEFVDFKKTPPTRSDILRWKEARGELPVNAKGTTYKKHKEIYKALSEDKKTGFLMENSSMIKRPILEKNGKVLAFGFSEEEYKSILK